jgi:metallo-beta-lactamase class B
MELLGNNWCKARHSYSNKNRIRNFLILSFIFFYGISTGFSQTSVYKTKDLEILELSPSTYIHISYLATNDFGRVSCNGLIVLDQKEAFVLDTPVDEKASFELIQWIQLIKDAKLIGVLATHFHNDCLGGLKTFHEQGIPSFAFRETINLANLNGFEAPQSGFELNEEWKVGTKTLFSVFLGEGHTRDNVVCYVKEEKVLFGGCLVKEIEASKGYIGDANLKEWSHTIDKVKNTFPESRWVVPGHGRAGGDELLDYTSKLFR